MRSRGMTLIEILVALLITMLMMSFLGTIYVRTMRVRRRTEEIAGLHATAGAAFGLLRRDLTGALRLAAETYDFGTYKSGAEFHWEGPVGGNPANGFRRIGLVTAMDGSRKFERDPATGEWVDGDPLGPYEYDIVTWTARGGAFFREVGSWGVTVNIIPPPPLPSGWTIDSFVPPPAPPAPWGVRIGAEVCIDTGETFQSVGPYRNVPYIRTSILGEGNLPQVWTFDTPITAIVCFDVARSAAAGTLPGWVETDYRPLPGSLTLASNLTTYRAYARPCPDGKVPLGKNGAGTMYFVILEPLWWSLGEAAEDLVFKAPSAALPAGPNADGVYTGAVPKYVDVELTISDPDHPLGRRVFGERIAIPSGVVP